MITIQTTLQTDGQMDDRRHTIAIPRYARTCFTRW